MPDDSSARLTIAAEALHVPESEMTPFGVDDTFNGDQLIEGHLCRRSDHRYGALVIHAVAGLAVEPQTIYATPKVPYPFGRTDEEERIYHWPKAVVRVDAYEKLDGTNVCAYSYADASGRRFVTYKTRLTPVLKASKYGDFAALWREVLPAHQPTIDRLVMGGHASASFELWGYRNPHLISYDVALEARLLFTVRQNDATILPPWPFVDPVRSFASSGDLTAFYDEMRAEAGKRNRPVDDEMVDGTEGYVFYVIDKDDGWTMWKCKPANIEALHWAGDRIPLSVLVPTAWNAAESDDLSVYGVSQLLAEEFSATHIRNSYNRIEQAVAFVEGRLAWRAEVQAAYEATGLDFAGDGKAAVMRALSGRFERGEMRRVFTALRECGVTA